MIMNLAFSVAMRNQADFDIAAIGLADIPRRLFEITNSFTDVIRNCEPRHILLRNGSLPTRHETRGHDEYC